MLLIGAIAFASFTSSAQIQGYGVGDTVDNFTVTDTNGNTHDLYAYAEAGKYILLDFFLTLVALVREPLQSSMSFMINSVATLVMSSVSQ